ncbi:MAG: hypothetical protein D4R63_07280 [Methylococcaceae bacterium]|nr:MAG: hypothetical protein D4R63_07280 [Methylococcaceae bacterium]
MNKFSVNHKISAFAIAVATAFVCSSANAGGWKATVSNDFTATSDITGWEFTLPWNSTYKTSDYLLEKGYLELQMLQTDKGGSVLSPKFLIKGNIKVTVKHYMHQADAPYFGNIELRDETSAPTQFSGIANVIHLGFQNSDYSPDYVCSAFDIPRVADTNGCIPKSFQGTTTSSSLYDRWITTIIRYSPQNGKLTIDYENDGTIDFNGTVSKKGRFTPSRIAFSGYGWYTGHFHRIDSVRIESTN